MIFVIVPAYNEAKNIGRVINGLFEHNFQKVIVVDDGSTDNTVALARQAGAVVLQHEINRGQGAALQTGNEYAFQNGAERVVHFDADGQLSPTDIAGALEALNTRDVDVLLGSRFLDNRSSSIPWTKRYILLPVSRLVNWFLTGIHLTDAHNGFRILTRKALEKITISQDRMAHNSEIVQQVKRQKLTFMEYPVEVKYFEYGQDISGGFKILQDIIAAKFLR